MKIKSIAPWFGGKRTLGPTIVAELGKHSAYFEPFCGSLAVVMAKPVVAQETVNDLHGDATNLAWVLQDLQLAEQLYDRAQRTLFAEAMIRQLWRELVDSEAPAEPCVDRAYKFFAYSWAMRNGVSGTQRSRGNGFQIALRYTPGGGSPTVRFRSATESIPAWHDRLRNVVIMRRDAFAVLPRFDDSPKLAIYADPPYHSQSRSGYAAKGATSRYEHEFDHDNPLFGDDHLRLRDALAKFVRARVVISYYDCPAIRRIYAAAPWQIVEVSRHKNLSTQNHRGSRRTDAPEILIINGPSLGESRLAT